MALSMKLPRFDLYTRANQLVIDGLLFLCSFVTAYFIRFDGVPPASYRVQLLFGAPILLTLRLCVHWQSGIYRFIWRYVSLSDVLAIGRSLTWPTLAMLALRVAYPDWAPLPDYFRVPLSVIALEFLLSYVVSLAARVLRRTLYLRYALATVQRGARSNVLLIGAGSTGIIVAKELAINPHLELIGFLDDDPGKIGSVVNGLPVMGPTSSLPSVVEKERVGQVIICFTHPTRAVIKRLWNFCEGLEVQCKIAPSIREVLDSPGSLGIFREVNFAELLGRDSRTPAPLLPEVTSAYSGQRILVAGAGGSIGSELARHLLKLEPRDLILLDKDENGLHETYTQLMESRGATAIHPVVADLRFGDRLEALLGRFRPTVVFHAANHKHVPLMEWNPEECILNNVTSTRNLVEKSMQSEVDRFVYISSDKAVRPRSVMGASKRVGELIVLANSLDSPRHFQSVRFGNVAGSRGSVIPLFQRQIAQGGPVTLTHPKVRRYFMTIDEAVRLVLQAGVLGSSGEIFILDMGDPVPILDLVNELIELHGLRPGKDIQIEVTRLRPGEKLEEDLTDPALEVVSATPFERIWAARLRQELSPDFLHRSVTALEEAARRGGIEEIYRILRGLNVGFEPGENEQAASP